MTTQDKALRLRLRLRTYLAGREIDKEDRAAWLADIIIPFIKEYVAEVIGEQMKKDEGVDKGLWIDTDGERGYNYAINVIRKRAGLENK